MSATAAERSLSTIVLVTNPFSVRVGSNTEVYSLELIRKMYIYIYISPNGACRSTR